MKKVMIALVPVTIILLSLTYAYAQGPFFGPGHRWPDRKGLFLTPEQQTGLHELQRKFNEETAQLRGGLLTKRIELQSLWSNPSADAKAILDREKELRDLLNRMNEKVVQYKLEFRKLLTPEQISKFGRGPGMGFGFSRGPMMDFDLGIDYRAPFFGLCH